MRIGIGLSWLAIVAAEMLIGGVGIGFFIWDAWNSSLISEIILALIYVGIIGFLLDRMIAGLGKDRHPRHVGRLKEQVMRLSEDRTDRQGLHARQCVDRGAEGRQSDDREGRVRLDHRPFRLRQVHAAQHRGGTDRPTTGRVLLENREVNSPGPDRAVVFQNHSLLPWLTAYANVRLGVDKVFGKSKIRARARRMDDA